MNAMQAVRVIDVETTGLDPESDAIVECAAVDVAVIEGDCVTVRGGRQWLIDPGKPIPPEASAIHHLTDDDVRGRLKWNQVYAAIGSLDPCDYYAAHNAKFDQAFTKLPGQWICTRKVATRLYPHAPAHSNQVLRYWLQLDVCDDAKGLMPHRALHDAFVTAALLVRLLDDVDIEQAVAWSNEPCLLPRVPFGKHKGAEWSSVPKDYLRWCIGQDMDEDVKFTCTHWLGQ